MAASTSAEELCSRMEDDFAFIACMVSSTSQCVWYIDSGASFHMTGVRGYSILEGEWKDNSTS